MSWSTWLHTWPWSDSAAGVGQRDAPQRALWEGLTDRSLAESGQTKRSHRIGGVKRRLCKYSSVPDGARIPSRHLLQCFVEGFAPLFQKLILQDGIAFRVFMASLPVRRLLCFSPGSDCPTFNSETCSAAVAQEKRFMPVSTCALASTYPSTLLCQVTCMP